jgi:SAM-dependent methyltransferase
VDPSAALEVAQRNLAGQGNCIFHRAHAGAIPVPDGSLDFGYSLGVLHHVPDPAAALAACVRKLKPGAPFLLYLYYALDNRPAWFRGIWRAADMVRLGVARLPARLRFAVCDGIAAGVYWPLSRLSAALEWTGLRVDGLPLAQYRRRSFYTLRTDALDRFGTRLERRFRREEMADMMEKAGLGDIHFSEREPFWCAVGIKASDTGGRP